MGTVNDAMDANAVRAQLSKVNTSLAADVLKAHAPDRLVMRGVRPQGRIKAIVCGPARTLRFLPARLDVKPPPGNIRMRLIDDVKSGEVLVFDAASVPANPIFGDMTALRAARNGAAALVTDGLIRDADVTAEIGLPVFAAGAWPAPNPAPLMAWEADVPIQCGGVLVMPGDWILADGDGVMVIPPMLLPTVIEKAAQLLREEEFCRTLLERGHPLKEAYPMPAGLRPFYERYLRDGTLPTEAEVRQCS